MEDAAFGNTVPSLDMSEDDLAAWCRITGAEDEPPTYWSESSLLSVLFRRTPEFFCTTAGKCGNCCS